MEARASAFRAGEKVVAATDGHASHGAFGRRFIDLDGAVVAIAPARV
jgi:hypothetical protein